MPIYLETLDLYTEQAWIRCGAVAVGRGGDGNVGPLRFRPTSDAPGRAVLFEVTTKVVRWEVEPGNVVDAWTYNGTVPGPTIRVNPGDKVRVVLKNELPESSTIHFHGLDLPNALDGVPGITQPPVKPGESYTYDFTAQSTPPWACTTPITTRPSK